MKKIDLLKKTALTHNGFDGYLLFNSANLLYFLGFPCATSLLVPADGESTVYVNEKNYEQAKAEGKRFKIELVKSNENLTTKIVQQTQNYKIQKLAVDELNVASWQALTKEFPKKNVLEVTSSYVQALRAVKDKQEIACMRKAGGLTSEGMKAAREAVKPGAKEYEVAAEAEYAMRKRGSGPTAFETIVVSGANSAFPHGVCSERVIREGDLVVVDIGATYKFYCSDMTRTFVAGKPSQKQQKLYDNVNTAQDKAFQTIKAGVTAAEIDTSARKIIEAAGYSEYFVHRLGHGVGLEIHEPPFLNPTNKEKLVVGNVVTDEPGIYLPGYGGIRIEDTVLVQRNRGEKLTDGPYSLSKE